MLFHLPADTSTTMNVKIKQIKISHWDDYSVLLLVEQFHENDVLWNPRNPNHKNGEKITEALNSIANILNVNKREIERKLKNLSCHYFREKNKFEESRRSGAGADEPKWFAYKPLDFLRNKYRPSCPETAFVESQQDQVRSSSRKKTSKQDISNDNSNSMDIDEDLKVPKVVPAINIRDEASNFGEYIASKIRKMDHITSTTVEHHIQNIIFQAEMGRYPQLHIPDVGSKVGRVEADVGSKVRRVEADVGSKVGSVEADVRSKVGSVEADVGSKVGRVEADVGSKAKRVEADVGSKLESVEADVGSKVRRVEADVGSKVRRVKADVGSKVRRVKADVGSKLESVEADVGSKVRRVEADVGSKVRRVKAYVGSKVGRVEADVGSKVTRLKADVGSKVGTVEADVGSKVRRVKADVGSKVRRVEADVGSKVRRVKANVGSKVRRVEADVGSKVGRVEDDVGSKVGRVEADVGSKVGRVEADVGSKVGRVEAVVGSKVGRAEADVGSKVGRVEADVGSKVRRVDTDVGSKVRRVEADVGSKLGSVETDKRFSVSPDYVTGQFDGGQAIMGRYSQLHIPKVREKRVETDVGSSFSPDYRGITEQFNEDSRSSHVPKVEIIDTDEEYSVSPGYYLNLGQIITRQCTEDLAEMERYSHTPKIKTDENPSNSPGYKFLLTSTFDKEQTYDNPSLCPATGPFEEKRSCLSAGECSYVEFLLTLREEEDLKAFQYADSLEKKNYKV